MLVLVAAVAAALAPAASAAERFVPGEALVRYEPGTSSAERAAARERADVTLEEVLGLRSVTTQNPVVLAMRR